MSSDTNPHEAGKVEVAGVAMDLADPPPTHPVGCCREMKDEMIGPEMKQTGGGTNTRVEQSMVGSQTLTEKVLAYAAAVAKRQQKTLKASEEALQAAVHETEWLQEERRDTAEEKVCPERAGSGAADTAHRLYKRAAGDSDEMRRDEAWRRIELAPAWARF